MPSSVTIPAWECHLFLKLCQRIHCIMTGYIPFVCITQEIKFLAVSLPVFFFLIHAKGGGETFYYISFLPCIF